jgi:hypothetical protein
LVLDEVRGCVTPEFGVKIPDEVIAAVRDIRQRLVSTGMMGA